MWRQVKQITSKDGQARLDFMVHSDGRVRFDQRKWYGPWEEDGVALDQGGWSLGPMSGYYANLAQAEAGARDDVPWFRNEGH